jgi:benzoyl-CoA reductase subunit C
MDILSEFHNIVNSPHQFAMDWKKKTGGKVMGYICTNLPEELMYAAGTLPVRLLGTNEPEDVTKPYIFAASFCPFCRDCFAQALQGKYDYIDGVSFALVCTHARQIFEGWKKHMPIQYSYQMHLPNLQNNYSKAYITGEMEDFKHSLEEWTGKQITTQKIDNAIELYNTNRRLMASVYELMKVEVPPVTEAEVAEIALAGMLIDKETHNNLLKQVLKELPKRKNVGNTREPRLMLLGSVNNNIDFIKFIDSLGGRVVIDDYCTGSRYYQAEVILEENRMAALAGRTIRKPPCPMKDLPERWRMPHILKLAEDYRVKGVIYTIQRLCDSHGLDYIAIESALKEKGIPMLKLEMDLGIPFGQFRTRIEAFLEMIEASSEM